MIELEKNMPTSLKKRRVVYLPDQIWEEITQTSLRMNISKSKALRILLQGSGIHE